VDRRSCDHRALTRRVFTYCAYGLGIGSELPLPELVAAQASADVTIRFGERTSSLEGANPCGYSFQADTNEIHLWWEGIGRFRIRAGREIIIELEKGIDDALLRTLVLGPALAVLLHQWGVLILHGSAVVLDGTAIGFLGQSGAGKSTMAATLHARGYPVLADDVIAIRKVAGTPLVLPAYPQLNLWPDSAASLGEDLSRVSRLHSRIEKRAIPAAAGFPRNPLPLYCLYVLEKGPRCGIEPLRPQEAFVELLRHSYGQRLLNAGGAPSHFEQCASLVRTTRIRRLTVCRALSRLDLLAQLVEKDALHNAA
jgi:hypothetical protein